MKRRLDIKGAPYKIGNIVRVLNNPNEDETFNKHLSGKLGQIEYFEYDCGCGQTFPEDPMIGVRFSNCKSEEFWKEEIELITSSHIAPCF